MKHLIKKLIREECNKVVLLEELSLIIETEIKVGSALTKKLESINKPYADRLLKFLTSDNISDKVAGKIEGVEYSDSDDGKLTAYSKDINGNLKDTKYKVGKLLKYLGVQLDEYYGYELEDLITQLKKPSEDEMENLIVVDGDEILWAYHCANYEEDSYDPTMGSCMRYDAAQEYLGIYTENPDKIKCLVLVHPEDSDIVRGRALLWLTDNGNKFMDRIFTVSNEYEKIFYRYADQNGYETETESSVTLTNPEKFEKYPYMDTFKYYTPDKNILTIDEIDETSILLDDIDGGPERVKLADSYGDNVYGSVDDVVELFNGEYAYDKDTKPLISSYYDTDASSSNYRNMFSDSNKNITPYAMKDEVVKLYPDFYDNDSYALHDDVIKITIPYDGEFWILKVDAEDFEEYTERDDDIDGGYDTSKDDYELKSDDDTVYDFEHEEDEEAEYALNEGSKILIRALLREGLLSENYKDII